MKLAKPRPNAKLLPPIKRLARLALLALAALPLLAASAPSEARQDRAVHEARRPGAPVQFRISRPIDWRPEDSVSAQSVSISFTKDDWDQSLGRSFTASAVTNSPDANRAGDVFLLSKAEREAVISVLAAELAQAQGYAVNFSSVKVVKLDGINGIKGDYVSHSEIDGNRYYSLNELTYIPYTQNVNNTLTSAVITLHCRYSTYPGNERRLTRTFRGEGRRTCKKFYDSLAILDRWR